MELFQVAGVHPAPAVRTTNISVYLCTAYTYIDKVRQLLSLIIYEHAATLYNWMTRRKKSQFLTPLQD